MRLGITLAVGLMLLGLPGTASAAPPLGPDGETAPVYDYTQAVRERVLIPQPGIDQDGNGVPDKITVDIIRPSGSGPANKIPAIIDPSPYFTTLCRGLRGECMGDMDADGVNDHWPLFLDNFFVPRGYAVILGQMNGTGYTSDGCPMHGGPGDVAGEKSIIDWLNGRVAGLAAPNWHNGKAAMIGKSYDGTLANGVAATGVDGLTTIVPQSAISDWYDYSRSNGIRTSSTHYPTFLNQAITFDATPSPGVSLPNRLSICNAAVNTGFNTIDGDDTGDRNPFWEQRNYRTNVGNVKAAVFAVHGFQDDNVKMDQLWPWWNGLKAAGVPRKLWLLRSGHTDPFDARRDVWVDTLHRWFDHWLYGVDNGIMSEPAVTIEDDKDVWGEYGDWPIPGTSDVNVFLQGTTADAAGALRGTSGGPLDSVAFTGTSNIPSETTVMNTPEGQQTSRRVFLSRPLTKDVRLSGLATIDLHASLSTAQSNLGAVLVDYNATTFPEVSRNGEGISSSGPLTSCWGTESTYDKSCYAAVTKPIQNVTQWRVTRGILDSSNRDSLTTPQPVTPGANTAFSIPLEPTEHTFAAGHQIGVVIVGNLLGTAGTPSSQITVDTKLSKLVLPVAGGDAAARASALTDETAPATTASFSPAANAAGWTRATSVTLTADDGDGSGAATLAYTLNGARADRAGPDGDAAAGRRHDQPHLCRHRPRRAHRGRAVADAEGRRHRAGADVHPPGHHHLRARGDRRAQPRVHGRRLRHRGLHRPGEARHEQGRRVHGGGDRDRHSGQHLDPELGLQGARHAAETGSEDQARPQARAHQPGRRDGEDHGRGTNPDREAAPPRHPRGDPPAEEEPSQDCRAEARHKGGQLAPHAERDSAPTALTRWSRGHPRG